ncbi:LADA_0F04896g1_1 [Lachancea dasiensis]|uniref:LADA_0F04896g1_1 n=1 Tax=Lachancea dasiensis TaxID=1072105 RepID=A0A1G4JJF5_9SACH|nr:LADA_0F04896g1_1 [Lachancea dasiensis]
MGRPPKIVSQRKIEKFQLELELAGQDAEILLKDKKGRSRSCLLCQRRKRRCDHNMPSCTACLKAGVKCIQPPKYASPGPLEEVPPVSTLDRPKPLFQVELSGGQTLSKKNEKYDYTRLLEKKLKHLEAIVEMPFTEESLRDELANYKRVSHLLDVAGLEEPQGQQTRIATGSAGTSTPQFSMAPPLSSAASSPILPPLQTVKLYPLQPEPHNKGRSPLRDNVGNCLASLTSDSLEPIDFSQCIFAKYNLRDFLSYDPAFEFEEQLSRAFLDTYFTRLQFKYPLLDEQEVYLFHDNYSSNNVYSYSTEEFHFGCGRMWLIFSISACLHMSAGKYLGLPPNRYFSTAIRHITKCGKNLTHLQQVEVLTLLVLYIIRTDRDSSGLYEIMKDIMSICKDKLNLNKLNSSGHIDGKNLRLFWCVYLMERTICVAVGKPYTIAESDIDLPLFDEVSFNNSLISDQKRHKRGVHFINQSLKLRRIESQFVEALQIIPQMPSRSSENHKETTELAKQLPQVKKYFHDLEIWRSNCSTSHVLSFENETLKLYYFRSVRLLIQPYLELLEPENRLFRECQAAAGQICQLYKIFHQKTVYGHSTPAVHTVFVAGVTLIYCMWVTRNLDDERRRKLGDVSKHTRPLVSASLFSIMDDLRACSVCLYVMTERSKFAITFRDTFDQLMNATIGNLIERCGPDSAELIYINEDASDQDSSYDAHSEKSDDFQMQQDAQTHQEGMPPAIRRTFGSSGDAHVSFVKIDPEEQKVLEKKRGDLQKATVPQKLSHLLAPDIEDDDIDSPGRSTRRKSTGSGRQLTEKDKYFVKKPAHITESDWQAFQQQAFLQQHHAQQTLQAYLSSLSGMLGDRHQEDRCTSHISANKLEKKIVTDDVSASKPMPVSSTAPVIDPHTQPNHDNENESTASENAPKAIVRSTRPPFRTPQRSVSNRLSNGFMGSEDYGGVFFNNGTHNMINNISTWTNDSVVDLMNNCQMDYGLVSNVNPSDMPSRTGTTVGGGHGHWGQYQMPPNPTGLISTSEIGPSAAQQQQDKQRQFSNGINHNQIHQRETYGNQPFSKDQEARQQSLSTSQLQSQQLVNSIPSQQIEHPYAPSHPSRLTSQPVRGYLQADIAFGTPVEDFWAVDDDYGFLA